MDSRGWDRREFLKSAGAATLAALAAGSPRAWASPSAPEVVVNPKPTADAMILLWMGGAMSQNESFDPKRHTPFEKGLEIDRLLSTFPTIDTAADHIKFAEGVEQIGSVIDRGTVLRSYVARDHGALAENLQHIPFQYKWHTGYTLPSTVPAPFMGAWVSRALGPRNPDIPAYIEIGRSEKTANVFLSLGAFNAAGFLGSEHAPLMIPDPTRAMESLRSRLPVERFENRYRAFRAVADASPIGQLGSGYQRESLMRAMEGAYRLMHSPAVEAFDTHSESPAVLSRYGTGPFGQGCLIARRLVERGARFVEVHVDFEAAKGWDTHNDGHNGQARMKKAVDGPIAQLIRDLEERGLLNRTLVVLGSEFGRASRGRGSTPGKTIEKMDQYGLHGHFGSSAACLMFGGGVRRGHVYGKTADEFPCETIENPVTIEDLHATIYRCLGISPKLNSEFEKRPFYITRDGRGKPVPGLLA